MNGVDITQPRKYRKRPIVIEAMPLTIDNLGAVTEWVGTHLEDGVEVANFKPFLVAQPLLWVSANQAWVPVEVGNEFIAHDDLGFYPIKRNTFMKTYEALDDDEQ